MFNTKNLTVSCRPMPDHIIITRKWFPLQGELAPLTKNWYFLIKNKPILIRSMLAAGIVQDTFAGEAGEGKGGKEEMTEDMTK